MCEVVHQDKHDGVERGNLELAAALGKTDKDSGGENEEEKSNVKQK